MNEIPTPRFDSWWNSYRSGAISANDFKEAMQEIERENEKCHRCIIAPLHAKSVMEQLNRAQAFAGSPKARKLYRDAYDVIKSLLPNTAA